MATDGQETVTVRGTGCHGAMPETGVDPLNIAAHIYLALQELPAREVAAICCLWDDL